MVAGERNFIHSKEKEAVPCPLDVSLVIWTLLGRDWLQQRSPHPEFWTYWSMLCSRTLTRKLLNARVKFFSLIQINVSVLAMKMEVMKKKAFYSIGTFMETTIIKSQVLDLFQRIKFFRLKRMVIRILAMEIEVKLKNLFFYGNII